MKRNHLLVIEDNKSDLELILYTLQESEMELGIDVVRDGAEALEYLFSIGKYSNQDAYELPKAILLDLKLPKIDGFGVLERVRSNPNTRKIPVVVLSSSGQLSDIERAYQLGANSYVVKPVDFAAFTETVRSLGTYWSSINCITP